jgi:hypothetical protein
MGDGCVANNDWKSSLAVPIETRALSIPVIVKSRGIWVEDKTGIAEKTK